MMRTTFKQVSQLLAAALLIPFAVCRAQLSPTEKQGSVYCEKNQPQRLAALEKIRAVVEQDPLLKPPVGFDAVYHEFDMDAPKEIPWQKPRPTVIDFGLPEYYPDRNGTIKLSSEAMADLDIEVNSFRRLYEDTYSHDLDAAGYPCPIFFFRYHKKTADSTREYVEYGLLDDSKPVRVVTNGKPLFVPLTREQYLNFQVRSNQKNVDDARRGYVHDSVTIANIAGKQDILNADRDLVNTWRQRLERHKDQLARLSAEEKGEPAFIIWGGGASGGMTGGTSGGMTGGTTGENAGGMTGGNAEDLTTVDDSRAKELWTPNPGYFDKRLPPGAIQMIVVMPEYAHIATDFIKAKVMDLYRRLDYKALKELIEN